MTVPNNPFPALAHAVDPAVVRSIRQASQATSTDFGLLMAQAARESGFRPDAKSASSSAAGLFQFVDSTWLDMVRRFGDKYGVRELAQQISQTSGGKLAVSNPDLKQKILDLRQDPEISACLAAEYTKQNQAELEQALGRPLSRGDLYMAHFLGAGGAAQFLKALDSEGGTIAAKILPEAAAANPGIFYDGNGRARTVGEIYQSVASKIEKDATGFATGSSEALSFSLASSASRNSAVASAPGLDFGPDGGTTAAMPMPAVGHTFDWSGVKLSAPMLAMLNVVALAALRMTENGGAAQDAPQAPPRAPTPHGEHSI